MIRWLLLGYVLGLIQTYYHMRVRERNFRADWERGYLWDVSIAKWRERIKK